MAAVGATWIRRQNIFDICDCDWLHQGGVYWAVVDAYSLRRLVLQYCMAWCNVVARRTFAIASTILASNIGWRLCLHRLMESKFLLMAGCGRPGVNCFCLQMLVKAGRMMLEMRLSGGGATWFFCASPVSLCHLVAL